MASEWRWVAEKTDGPVTGFVPVLERSDIKSIAELPMWFATEADCEAFIRDVILKAELYREYIPSMD